MREPAARAHPQIFGTLRLCTSPVRHDFDAIENLAEIALRDLNIIVVLQVEPKLCGCAECLGKRKRSVVRGKPQALARAPADILSPSAVQTKHTWRLVLIVIEFVEVAQFSARHLDQIGRKALRTFAIEDASVVLSRKFLILRPVII
jgi:hypothetical protein